MAVKFIYLIFLAIMSAAVLASDGPTLQDFCVADLKSSSKSIIMTIHFHCIMYINLIINAGWYNCFENITKCNPISCYDSSSEWKGMQGSEARYSQ